MFHGRRNVYVPTSDNCSIQVYPEHDTGAVLYQQPGAVQKLVPTMQASQPEVEHAQALPVMVKAQYIQPQQPGQGQVQPAQMQPAQVQGYYPAQQPGQMVPQYPQQQQQIYSPYAAPPGQPLGYTVVPVQPVAAGAGQQQYAATATPNRYQTQVQENEDPNACRL